MTKVILFLSLLVMPLAVFATDGAADDATDDLNAWARERSETDPEVVDGVRMFRPAPSDGKLVVSDFFDLAGISDEDIFVGALVYAFDHLNKETDVVETIESSAKRFVVSRYDLYGKGRDEMEFACETAFQVVDGMLSFVTYNIQTAFKEKGILPRKMAIEKLKPQEKEQHKNVVETFSYVNSKFLQEMVEYVKSAQNQPVTHWEEIETGDVVKGMNETEVKLAAGRPSTVREQGNKTRWMYSNTFVVVFTDGVVTTVVM